MLLTGEVDYRTPISESEQFYQALKLQKVEAALVRIPEASHGIATGDTRDWNRADFASSIGTKSPRD